MKNTLMVFLLLICFFRSFPQVNLSNGLVAYYPFTGNANDASGNGNNAVFNNATLTADRFGNPNSAYLFNGIDNYIQIPNSPTLNPANQISICAWVKVSGFYQGPCHGNNIVMKGDGDYLPGNYMIRFDDSYYTNSQNCSITTPDISHESFFGINSAPYSNTPFIQTNQWYSVVYTSDGVTAKIYVNCQLVGSGPANGATFTNNYDLFLGHLNNAQYPYWFNGVMDEIRIYNRPLNTDEVNAYSGCLNSTDSVIINDYTPVLSFDICKNEITVADASKYNPGDTVLLIQMKGAAVDSSNTSNFGNVSNYKNAGNYEYNYVKQKTGNVIQLKNLVTRQYDIPSGKVQLIRVPYYSNITFNNTITCLPWNGSIGGVLAFNVKDTLTLNSDIDISGRGFIGGDGSHGVPSTYNCYENQFYYPQNTILAAGKGEGIATLLNDKINGKGKYSNGGGGGDSHNAGGGGGGNAATGGFGGYEFEGSPCDGTTPFDNRGIGGTGLTYNNVSNKIFMGGGGGAGHANNPELFFPNGGNGGGICIINANIVNGNNKNILANGNNAVACSGYGVTGCHEGMGGGGSGGTILINANVYYSPTNSIAVGGNGADMVQSGNLRVGPGGGGGGGITWLNNATVPGNLTIDVMGGINGVCTSYANSPYGTTPGDAGINLFNLKIPVDTILFKPNIDSIRIEDTAYCSFTAFGGWTYTQFAPINTWQWNFGDGTPTILGQQVVVHIYSLPGTYTVKLTVTDNNGCKDSISKPIIVNQLIITKTPDTSICGGAAIQLFAAGGSTYTWTPATSLNNPNINNPLATPLVTTIYHVTVTNASGCSKDDSVKIIVNNLPTISKSKDTGVCNNASVQLFASGGTSYLWTPAATLSNPNISNPIATPPATTIYHITVTNVEGCSKIDSVKISTSAPPVISKSSDQSICKNTSVQLFASGGSTYLWSPVSSLDNAAIPNPVATPNAATTYYVTVTNSGGCGKTDSVKIGINPAPVITKSNDTTICNKASVRIFANGGTSYLWSPASSLDDPTSSAPIASPLATTIYKVVITDAYSCDYQDSVLVSVRAAIAFTVSPDGSVCSGSSKQLEASGGDTYLWSPVDGLDNPNTSNPMATPASTTTYTVTIHENTCNETGTVSTSVTVLPLPDVNATSANDLTCSLGSSQLNATGATSYTWEPATGLNNSNIATPVASPSNTTLYTVTGKDANDCTNTDTVTVKTDFSMNALYLLPNSFTPNGDGVNDCFGIKYWGIVHELDFSIYNRFGERVFHTTNPNACWDGIYKGKPQNVNVFVYVITAKTACGIVNRKGTVSLLK